MLSRRSTLSTVALAVGDVLSRHGIRAVLTGGACASLYRRWSESEGAAERYAEFERDLERARKSRAPRRRP